MKVQIKLKTPTNKEDDLVLRLTVSDLDTASSVKDRVASVQPIPFPDQDLMLDGEVLEDGRKLCDCGVKEGSSLDLVVKASETIFVKQLSELLQARDLSCDELGLLYCYKHGANLNQALKTIGYDGKLEDFIAGQKTLALESSRVALVRQDTTLKPFSVASEVETILKAEESGWMDVKSLNTKFLKKFNVSLASLCGSKPCDFLAKEMDLFVVHGHHVGLRHVQKKPNTKTCEEPTVTPMGLQTTTDVENKQYNDLHGKISSRTFNSRVAQMLGGIVDLLMEMAFLNIDHIVKGGAVGKGTPISGGADAEVVCFVRDLPAAAHDRWLPPLLRAVAGILSSRVSSDRHCGEPSLESVEAAEDSVQVRVKDLDGVKVAIRFSRTFESYAATIQTLGEQCPEERRFYSASLVKERVQFIARQAGSVKVTIRLLRWWRDQQEWSSKLVRPTDEVLELMAVYSAVQTKPVDQRAAIANVMSLMARFNELRIVWSNYYAKEDIWAPLLHQRPLLMDPVNPFVNVAEPQRFDARELMALAKTTHFFW